MNDAVSFIKKAGRNLLLTIERADVTEDQGEPTIFYVMSIYTLHMPLYKYISSISFDLKEDVSFKCLHHVHSQFLWMKNAECRLTKIKRHISVTVTRVKLNVDLDIL